ncbi:MAG: biopolymer transporter Tol [Chloroflexota bacterium]|jgi:Tol biopolymer transport system component|nr:biopolymer transporter Tol [Chloroflexota bacterium]
MTIDRRLERDLPQILGELAMGPYPDYIDDVLATTAQRRQRAAWTFPERWLPMFEVARQPVLAPRLPWRSISLAVLLIALLVAAAVFVGSQPRTPAPFGVARNGLIAYDAGGDIYAADPVTGVATAIVPGPETDVGPRYSPDGTHIVFERKLDSARVRLYVAGSNGADVTLITPDPIELTHPLLGEPWEPYQFSPDGRSVLIAISDRGTPTIAIAQSDGSGVRRLDVGMFAYEPSFRPPDGAEVLFVGNPGSAGRAHGLYAADVSSGAVRTIIEPSTVYDLAGATWSPDGSRIAYWRWGGAATGINARVHVISADGREDLLLPAPLEAAWQATSAWSNDGSRLFVLRGYSPTFEDVRPAVIPADGRSSGVELRVPVMLNGDCCANLEWAPDDSRILGTPTDAVGKPMQQLIIDPETGVTQPAPWTSSSDPTWQRLAL